VCFSVLQRSQVQRGAGPAAEGAAASCCCHALMFQHHTQQLQVAAVPAWPCIIPVYCLPACAAVGPSPVQCLCFSTCCRALAPMHQATT
jgi:hypothetical protein